MIMERLHRSFWSVYGRFVWDSDLPPIKKQVIRNVVDILRQQCFSSGEHVLDAGCGTGQYSFALANAGFQVTGIDYSAGMLACATSKVSTKLADHLSFQQLDMNQLLPFEDSYFHHVISISTLWTVVEPKFTLSELTRVVRPGGTLIVMQIPKHDDSLSKVIKIRIKHLEKKTPVVKALVAIKSVLERTSATKYWSAEELLALMLTNKELNISYVDHGPPIFIVATKIMRN